MFNRTHLIARTIAVLMLYLAWPAAGKAGIIPTDVTVTPEAGNFRWTYAVVLPSDMKLQSGDFFIVYNFAGLVPGTVSAPSGWTLTTPAVPPNPANITVPNTSNPNLLWTYTGPTIPTGQVGLGNFAVASIYSQSANGLFVGSNERTIDGVHDNNVTETLVAAAPTSTPPPPPGVPEPATLALAGLGLPLIAMFRRKKKE
jgi:hypothetical protein